MTPSLGETVDLEALLARMIASAEENGARYVPMETAQARALLARLRASECPAAGAAEVKEAIEEAICRHEEQAAVLEAVRSCCSDPGYCKVQRRYEDAQVEARRHRAKAAALRAATLTNGAGERWYRGAEVPIRDGKRELILYSAPFDNEPAIIVTPAGAATLGDAQPEPDWRGLVEEMYLGWRRGDDVAGPMHKARAWLGATPGAALAGQGSTDLDRYVYFDIGIHETAADWRAIASILRAQQPAGRAIEGWAVGSKYNTDAYVISPRRSPGDHRATLILHEAPPPVLHPEELK